MGRTMQSSERVELKFEELGRRLERLLFGLFRERFVEDHFVICCEDQNVLDKILEGGFAFHALRDGVLQSDKHLDEQKIKKARENILEHVCRTMSFSIASREEERTYDSTIILQKEYQKEELLLRLICKEIGLQEDFEGFLSATIPNHNANSAEHRKFVKIAKEVAKSLRSNVFSKSKKDEKVKSDEEVISRIDEDSSVGASPISQNKVLILN